MMPASEVEVSAFLRRCNEVIGRDGLDFWENTKNEKWLEDSGYVASDAEDIVTALTVENFSDGPRPDDNPNRPTGEVWIFGVEWQGFDLYVKLKLELPIIPGKQAVCMSMHEQEFPLVFPYRRRR